MRLMSSIQATFYFVSVVSVAGGVESSVDDFDKPVITQKPEDILITENNQAIFKCKVLDDPEFPSEILWRRENGRLSERFQQNAENSLVIYPVRLEDEGAYVCIANNSAGVREARAMLTVYSKPSFLHQPKNKAVLLGKNVKLKCGVTGKPEPSLFWGKRKGQLLLFPSQTHDRFSVDAWGTLKIRKILKEDAGEYVCNALSTAGSAAAVARIKVLERNLSKACVDYRGKKVFEGDIYSPERNDPCYKCRCSPVGPTNCTVITCDPPLCENVQQVRNECCRYRCMHVSKFTTEVIDKDSLMTKTPTKAVYTEHAPTDSASHASNPTTLLVGIAATLLLLLHH